MDSAALSGRDLALLGHVPSGSGQFSSEAFRSQVLIPKSKFQSSFNELLNTDSGEVIMTNRSDIIDGSGAIGRKYGLIYTKKCGWIDLGHANPEGAIHFGSKY
jgi:hypothetical protein